MLKSLKTLLGASKRTVKGRTSFGMATRGISPSLCITKEYFQLNDVRHRTGKRAKVHFDLVTLVYNASKLAADRIHAMPYSINNKLPYTIGFVHAQS